jgi:hypothetical protein
LAGLPAQSTSVLPDQQRYEAKFQAACQYKATAELTLATSLEPVPQPKAKAAMEPTTTSQRYYVGRQAAWSRFGDIRKPPAAICMIQYKKSRPGVGGA